MASTQINHELRLCALEGYHTERFSGEFTEHDEYLKDGTWRPISQRRAEPKPLDATVYIRRKIQPQSPQLDAGPGATVRSYLKLGEGEFLKIGDEYRVAGDSNWKTIPNHWSGDRLHKNTPKAEFRRPIDSPAQDTTQPPEEKPLIVEVGKRYFRDDGAITNPLAVNTHENSKDYPFYDTKYLFRYSLKGKSMDGWRHNSDLVSEYIEPEVEKKTRQVNGFRCPECDSSSGTYFDQMQEDGSFAPGDTARCLNCKTDTLWPRNKPEPSPGEGWRWLIPGVDTISENDEIKIFAGAEWCKCSALGNISKTRFLVRRNLAYEGLDALPDGYREAAKANWDRDFHMGHFISRPTASAYSVRYAFAWHKTPEGNRFWDAVWIAMRDGKELPPLPLYSIVNGKLTCPTDGTGTTRAQAIAENITRLENELEAARKIK